MVDKEMSLTRKSLKTPRAAAIAGILFALLYGSSLILIRSTLPANLEADPTWLETNIRRVSFALNLVPYAGIAFLWFIGVIRDRMGDMEDRFFATIFLGSGLLFIAMTFTGVALGGGLLATYVADRDALLASGVYLYGRMVMYQAINVFAFRMAGVFMISLGTIWLRTGMLRRGWALLTYALALILLLSINLSLWVTLIFPGWVLAVSVYFLILTLRERPENG